MPTYNVVRDAATGKTTGVLKDGISKVPNDPSSTEWQAFLAWNAVQPTPLVITDGVKTQRISRNIATILTDLIALTPAQKTNVSNNLFAAVAVTAQKWASDAGPNAGALLAIYLNTQTATLSVADKNLAKVYAAALYVQDNPLYLVNPVFDVSINVPGDMLAP